ncbi:MAG: ferrous iron transport protein B [Actinomycetota bacterium]
MAMSCHSVISELKEPVDVVIALAGNPNVGKSVIFNQLTGMGVVSANYPGTTMEVNVASTRLDDLSIGILDLPGTYGLGAISEDQRVARRCLLDEKPGALIYILDATNLERNLYMLLQLIELSTPVVVGLNLVDEAKRFGYTIDADQMSRMLGLPVVPTVAVTGEGVETLLRTAVGVAQGKVKLQPMRVRYGRDIEEKIEDLARVIIKELDERPVDIPVRALAIGLLEDDTEFQIVVGGANGGKKVLEEAERLAAEITEHHGEPAAIRFSRERHGLAGVIVESVKSVVSSKLPLTQRLWAYTVNPRTGIPLMLLVMALIFGFLFYVGGALSDVLTRLWQAGPHLLIQGAVFTVFGEGALGRTLLWGFDGGIVAALSVGVPYVLTFYLILAFLEDSGYLNSMAFLADTLMHKLGLHGRAVIPMVAGAGCNVPAIIGTRVLTSERERFIASTLIVLVPCSARVAVIMGGVAKFAGVSYALGIFAVSAAVALSVGWGLNKFMPGQSSGLVMEMFGLRRPSISVIAKKTWYRFKDFIFVAFPIVMVGSLVLGGLYETGLIWPISAPLKPIIITWLGLPLITGIALIFAVLRKELALQFLITFAVAQYGAGATNLLLFMTKQQLFVYGLVMTIYIPCIATVAVLGRELGWKRAAAIIALTVGIALLLGGVAYRVLALF